MYSTGNQIQQQQYNPLFMHKPLSNGFNQNNVQMQSNLPNEIHSYQSSSLQPQNFLSKGSNVQPNFGRNDSNQSITVLNNYNVGSSIGEINPQPFQSNLDAYKYQSIPFKKKVYDSEIKEQNLTSGSSYPKNQNNSSNLNSMMLNSNSNSKNSNSNKNIKLPTYQSMDFNEADQDMSKKSPCDISNIFGSEIRGTNELSIIGAQPFNKYVSTGNNSKLLRVYGSEKSGFGSEMFGLQTSHKDIWNERKY